MKKQYFIDKNIRPIVVVPAVPHNGGIRFLLLSDQIDIGSDMADIVWKIIGLSNGYNEIDDIVQKSELSVDIVSKVVSDLRCLGIMYDSRELYLHFHEISRSPDTYFRNFSRDDIWKYTMSSRLPVKKGRIETFDKDDESSLSKLIFNRRSCRSFSAEKLNKNIIGNICYHGYSIANHAVASGGGLYPLKIYVLIEKEQNDLPIGYYEYDAERDLLVQYSSKVDVEQLKYCFNDETIPFGSSVQIVIAADLRRQTYKYSNRGYRLTLIEAGQVAQNICLYCTENNICTCELGGVLDFPLIEEMDLSGDLINPLLVIAIGKKSENKRFDYLGFKDKIEECFVGVEKPVKIYGGYTFDEGASFFGAYSIYNDMLDEYAGATSTSYVHAASKAIIEGYERKQSGNLRTDYLGCASDLDCEWLDPTLIRPLTNEQINNGKLVQFSKSLPISWTRGKYINSGKNIFVPSDLVYYGHEMITNQICFSDSSGVAAYTDYDTAVYKAIMELVERDALMRNWYERKSPPKISEQVLSYHINRRIKYWKSKGRQVFVLDMQSPFAPTIQVIIKGSSYPYFVSGAATSIDNVEKAILKAFREAEFTLLLKLRYPEIENIDPKTVKVPKDHGLIYSFPEYISNIEWLWSSDCIKIDLPLPVYEYKDLLMELNPIVIDISEKDSMINVVRVISEKCIPISFGFGMDYYTHPVVKSLTYNPASRKLPHYFN